VLAYLLALRFQAEGVFSKLTITEIIRNLRREAGFARVLGDAFSWLFFNHLRNLGEFEQDGIVRLSKPPECFLIHVHLLSMEIDANGRPPDKWRCSPNQSLVCSSTAVQIVGGMLLACSKGVKRWHLSTQLR
jgi:hypothetical protein